MAESINHRGIVTRLRTKRKLESIKKQADEANSLQNLSAIALKIKSQEAKKARIPRYYNLDDDKVTQRRSKGGTGGTPPATPGRRPPGGECE